jgi:hypothetical protein
MMMELPRTLMKFFLEMDIVKTAEK